MNHSSSHLIVLLIVAIATPSLGLEQVSFRRDDKFMHVDGRIVVEAADGGLLLQDPQGVLWKITADEIVSRDSNALPFQPFDKEKMKRQLLKEFPDFRVHQTAHFLLCYNTSQAYARWCGALYERLYFAFNTYWKNLGFELHEPKWPLVALVFDGKQSYSNYAMHELGQSTSLIPAYYSLRTNRVAMYDLTGTQLGGQARRNSTADQINRLLSRPGAAWMVATIIHEATHQVAFNRGLEIRYADIPTWVSEGVAIFFETPDLRSKRGWRKAGAVNRVRLVDFRKYLRTRPQDSLETLISTNARFLDARTQLEAYAEAWALNYFLIHKYKSEYLQYTQLLSEKLPSRYDEAERRLAQFKDIFGEDLEKLDAEFLRYLRGLR